MSATMAQVRTFTAWKAAQARERALRRAYYDAIRTGADDAKELATDWAASVAALDAAFADNARAHQAWKHECDDFARRARHLRDLLRGVKHEQPDLLDGDARCSNCSHAPHDSACPAPDCKCAGGWLNRGAA